MFTVYWHGCDSEVTASWTLYKPCVQLWVQRLHGNANRNTSRHFSKVATRPILCRGKFIPHARQNTQMQTWAQDDVVAAEQQQQRNTAGQCVCQTDLQLLHTALKEHKPGAPDEVLWAFYGFGWKICGSTFVVYLGSTVLTLLFSPVTWHPRRDGQSGGCSGTQLLDWCHTLKYSCRKTKQKTLTAIEMMHVCVCTCARQCARTHLWPLTWTTQKKQRKLSNISQFKLLMVFFVFFQMLAKIKAKSDNAYMTQCSLLSGVSMLGLSNDEANRATVVDWMKSRCHFVQNKPVKETIVIIKYTLKRYSEI